MGVIAHPEVVDVLRLQGAEVLRSAHDLVGHILPRVPELWQAHKYGAALIGKPRRSGVDGPGDGDPLGPEHAQAALASVAERVNHVTLNEPMASLRAAQRPPRQVGVVNTKR